MGGILRKSLYRSNNGIWRTDAGPPEFLRLVSQVNLILSPLYRPLAFWMP